MSKTKEQQHALNHDNNDGNALLLLQKTGHSVASKCIGIGFRRRRLYIPNQTTVTIHNWTRGEKTAFEQGTTAGS